MALQLTGGPQCVSVPASASINDLTAFSWLGWFYLTSLPGTGDHFFFFRKSGNKQFSWERTTGGAKVNLTVDRSGSSDAQADSVLAVALGTWTFIAGTYDESDGPRLFTGTATAEVAELGYNTRDVGSNVTSPDSSEGLTIGGDADDDGIVGSMAFAKVVAARLTLAELKVEAQFPGRMLGMSTKLLHDYGRNHALSSIKDGSGNGNHGSAVTATYDDRAPQIPSQYAIAGRERGVSNTIVTGRRRLSPLFFS